MAAHTTSSPRDHVADANPDLARKKQRLSEEEKGTSTDESIIIEALEPEDIGTNIENAIEIEDDLSIIMATYTEDFNTSTGQLSPFEQMCHLQNDLSQNCYIKPEEFLWLAHAVDEHVSKTVNESSEWRQHYLDEEADFFGRLALVAINLLDAGDLFEPSVDSESPAMRQALEGLLLGLERLTHRIIPLLPEAIKGTLSRRDSAQVTKRQQSVGGLYYLLVAQRVLVETRTSRFFFQYDRRGRLGHILNQNRKNFYKDDMVAALSTVIRSLSGTMREIKDAWIILQSALVLFMDAIATFDAADQCPSAEVEEVMGIVNECILPAICEKHPRALPEGFHLLLVNLGMQALHSHVDCNDQASAAALYERFVKSDRDAVIPNSPDTDSTLKSLRQLCSEDLAMLARLLKTSWAMQAAHAFIRSDIMDVRNVGITSLKDQLVALWKAERSSVPGIEHPIIQYAVRFLRKNEITGYIFGPESRAGLVHHSADIICFLAATSTYTDAETDIIWQACSKSVEADFVKASFVVLQGLLNFLDFSHLIYIAKKYATTPMEKFDVDAFDFLDKLFTALEQKISSSGDASDKLALAFTSIEIFKAANNIGPSYQVRDRLRKTCTMQISKFANPRIQLEEKAEIYKHCIPEIRTSSEHATTAVEVLSILLEVRIQAAEAALVLAMFPVNAAVDEFCSFVQGKREDPFAQSSIFGAIVRLTCIARLMVLASDAPDKKAQDRLFDFAFGDSALCNDARNQAWIKLHQLATAKGPPSAASVLWQGFMQDHVPLLRAELATPSLIQFISGSLKTEFGHEGMSSDLTQILDVPLWTTLLRFATTSTDQLVINTAATVILDLLFNFPISTAIPRSVIVQYQNEFVRILIENLCRDYKDIGLSKEDAGPRKFMQGMHLLAALLGRSRETAAIYAPTVEPDKLDITNVTDKSEAMSFTAQVYGGTASPKEISIQATKDTKLEDLVASLPQKTGTTQNRVFAMGKEVSLDPGNTLSDAGVQQSSIIAVRPKYTFGVNLNDVLMCSSPVEQKVIDQYDSLEAFLDGPEYIAREVYAFLCNVRQSSQARLKVSSPTVTAQELFPRDRPWRSAFSLHVLQRHLLDLAHLGVADDGFNDRTIDLLVAVVLDASRPFQPLVVQEIAATLLKFLEGTLKQTSRIVTIQANQSTERFHDESGSPPYDLEPAFVSRMISLMFEGLAIPLDPSQPPNIQPPRTLTVTLLYKALLTACRTVPNLWNTFSEESNVIELHELLLLDNDPGLSSNIAGYIRSLCQDTTMSHDIPNFYWHAIIPSLSAALRKGGLSEVYFGLAIDILQRDVLTKANEPEIRGLIDDITSELWSYRHFESMQLPVADKAVGGLIRLLGLAITILKSFKKPLQLHGLASQLLRQLLFPPWDEPDRRPLVNAETRNLVYNVVRWSFEPDSDYDSAIDTACEATHRSSRQLGVPYPGYSEWVRPPWNAAGLSNLGMTCYMNSLLQQLFFNLQFRKFILQQSPFGLHDRHVLAGIQVLFAQMQDFTNPVVDTNALAQSLNVQVGNQEDVHTFYTTLLSRLEDNLAGSEDKLALTRFFTGKSVTQVKGECGHVSARTEPFTELSVTVKNKGSLVESLDEFVQGEPLEGANKYKCMTCEAGGGGRLVNALRRTCLEDVPDNLTFCLKRFTYESMIESENKVNDRFEFPRTIDMSLYKRSYLEDPEAARLPDEFELVGVIVHQGSLQYGHYWSYVRMPGASNVNSSVWMCLEDSRFFLCAGGIQEVQEQCIGGPKTPHGSERSDNAYVLFYQRKSYILEAGAIDLVSGQLRSQFQVQPRVGLPDGLALDANEDSKWRQHIESLFNDQFSAFIIWLIGQSHSVLEARIPAVSDLETSDTNSKSDQFTYGQIEMKLGDLIANFAMRILLADPNGEAQLDPFMTSLISLVDAHPTTAAHILRQFCGTDGFGFANMVRNESAKVRSRLFDGIWKCLSHLREEAPLAYEEILPMVHCSHASVIGPCLDAALGKWDEYLEFATKIARLGLQETGIILDHGYLTWVFEILHLRWDAETKKSHPAVNTWMRTTNPDLSGLFEFAFNLLSEHVDLSEDFRDLASGAEQRTRTSTGWCLRREELNKLFKGRQFNSHKVWILFLSGTRQCQQTSRWREYIPGKLFGLLVSEKANVELLRYLESALQVFYEYEELDLVPSLLLTLHYCHNRPDQDCKQIMVALAKNVILWEGSGKEALGFFEDAYAEAPSSTVNCIPFWAQHFFMSKRPPIRQRTLALFQTQVFGPPPLSENSALDAVRMRTTRAIVGQFIEYLTGVYNREQPRARYEEMIDTLEQASIYLVALQEAVVEQRQNGARLGPEILVEYDESRGVLAALMHFLDEIKHWEVETTLPTRTIDVRRSVEGDSDDSETSYPELDDASSEHDPA